MHFIRTPSQSSTAPITVKGVEIFPKVEAKILGVIMDPELQFKNHITRVAINRLKAVLALKRLKLLSPSVTRQLVTGCTPGMRASHGMRLGAGSHDKGKSWAGDWRLQSIRVIACTGMDWAVYIGLLRDTAH